MVRMLVVGMSLSRQEILRDWLKRDRDIHEVLQVETVRGACEYLETRNADAVLVELGSQYMTGLSLRNLSVSVVGDVFALTDSVDVGRVLESVQQGATVVTTFDDLAAARFSTLCEISSTPTRPLLSPEVCSAVVDWVMRLPAAAKRSRWADAQLTRREREVLELLESGSTYCGAASSLALSTDTVRSHVRNASRKLRSERC